MILIADSGSTKADWRIIKNDKQVVGFQTKGLNPFFVDNQTIIQEIEDNIPCDILPCDIENIHFFGAGCSSPDRVKIVNDALCYCFTRAQCTVFTDMEGAAIALLGNEPGIAAILGTGSNTCFWDGEKIAKTTPSLGYILGDEGSGTHLGKTLITQYLRNELPSDLEKLFEIKYNIPRSELLNRIYKGAFPNRFLASFASFYSENITHPFIIYTVSNCFLRFFERHIHTYENYSEYKICCVGSVAYYFKDILEECALVNDVEIHKIISKPIEELTNHYINKLTN